MNMPAIASLFDLLNEIKGKKPYDAITTVVNKTGYRSTFQRESDEPMLESLLNVAVGFDTTEELLLASSFLEEDSGQGVKLMTAHAAKGLEFDKVFVVGMEQGLWPHKYSTDQAEEARLFYVACTRARKYLNISYSKSKMSRGATIETSPSHLFVESLRFHRGI